MPYKSQGQALLDVLTISSKLGGSRIASRIIYFRVLTRKQFADRARSLLTHMANMVCKKWLLFQVEIKKNCYLNFVVQMTLSPLYHRSICTRPDDNTP